MARRPDPLKRQQWLSRIARFRRSDLTVAEFCEAEGVSAASFYSWRRRVGDGAQAGGGTAHEAAPGFQPVLVTAAPGSRVRMPSGVVLEIGDDLRALELVLDRLLAAEEAGSC